MLLSAVGTQVSSRTGDAGRPTPWDIPVRVAIFDNALYVVTDSYPFRLDTTTWGWIDLIVGVLVAGAGWAVFSGRLWGRVVGIVLAALSATANFLFLPYYPFWAILIIVLNVFVIWALAVHGREMTEL